jgi:hypothetical protein
MESRPNGQHQSCRPLPDDKPPLGCHHAFMGTTSHPVMTRRKQRAAEIASREAELRQWQGDFDRRRARAASERGRKGSVSERGRKGSVSERGRKGSVSDAERRMRAEMSALARERKILLEQVTRREAELRQRQSKYDRARAAAAKKGKQPPVSQAEHALRTELAVLESERAHLDGTAQRDRQDADI